MGEQLGENFAFPPRSKYPWDTWLDGTKWRIRSDIHFPGVKVGSMCRHIRTTAKDRGKRVRIVREHLPTSQDGSLITDPLAKFDQSAKFVDCLCILAFTEDEPSDPQIPISEPPVSQSPSSPDTEADAHPSDRAAVSRRHHQRPMETGK